MYKYVLLAEEPLIKDKAAEWFHSKWEIVLKKIIFILG